MIVRVTAEQVETNYYGVVVQARKLEHREFSEHWGKDVARYLLYQARSIRDGALARLMSWRNGDYHPVETT